MATTPDGHPLGTGVVVGPMAVPMPEIRVADAAVVGLGYRVPGYCAVDGGGPPAAGTEVPGAGPAQDATTSASSTPVTTNPVPVSLRSGDIGNNCTPLG